MATGSGGGLAADFGPDVHRRSIPSHEVCNGEFERRAYKNWPANLGRRGTLSLSAVITAYHAAEPRDERLL